MSSVAEWEKTDTQKEQGARVMSEWAPEIKNIPMAECNTYGTHQAVRGDISVSECVAYGVFKGQQLREGAREDDGVYEPITTY